MVRPAPKGLLSGLLCQSRFAGRIGIMGGSFNPPHAGHLATARRAREAARLQMVFWLVSPQNPLKSTDGMASLAARRTACTELTSGQNWLHVSSFETHLQNQTDHAQHPVLTAETLVALRRHLPRAQLIWIMGADNLCQFHEWTHTNVIRTAADVLVMGRPGFNYPALASRGRAQLGKRTKPACLTGRGEEMWAFDNSAYHPLSGTALRQAGKGVG